MSATSTSSSDTPAATPAAGEPYATVFKETSKAVSFSWARILKGGQVLATQSQRSPAQREAKTAVRSFTVQRTDSGAYRECMGVCGALMQWCMQDLV